MDEKEKDERKKEDLKTSEAPENASHEIHSDDDHENATAQHPDYCQELAGIVRGTITPKALKEKVENYHENDIADVLAILNRAEREKLYHVLDAQTLSTVLEYAEDIEVYLNELGLRAAYSGTFPHGDRQGGRVPENAGQNRAQQPDGSSGRGHPPRREPALVL